MIDFELKEILRKAYRAGRRNALKQDEANFNDFINKYQSVENLINEYKKEELPHANEPFHYEAEIAAGFKHFIEWLKRKEQ